MKLGPEAGVGSLTFVFSSRWKINTHVKIINDGISYLKLYITTTKTTIFHKQTQFSLNYETLQ